MTRISGRMTTEEQLDLGLMTCMGRAGILDYSKVARLSGLDSRTVRSLSEGTTVGTLLYIASALDCTISDLVAQVVVE